MTEIQLQVSMEFAKRTLEASITQPDPGAGTGGYPYFSMPTGFDVSGSGTANIVVTLAADYSLPTVNQQGQWNTAYSERLRWDGGAAGLVPATARTSLELGTAAQCDVGTAAGKVPLLNDAGQVPSALLPGFVDDVLEFANVGQFPATGETGKLYVSQETGRLYRWSGSIYIEILPSPGSTDAVPEGSVNLYFTDSRAAAAAPVRSVAGLTGDITLSPSDIGLGPVSTDAAGLQRATGFGSLQYASTMNLDLAALDGEVNQITLTGPLQLTASNLARGRTTALLLIPGASSRTLQFPVDWKPMGSKPAFIPANKEARLAIECWGIAETDVKFAISIQP